MAKDLEFLEDQAGSFATWVEDAKASILASRSRRKRHVSSSSVGKEGAPPTAAKPLVAVGDVVVSHKLVLQPNAETGPVPMASSKAVSPEVSAATKRKMTLLAEMTSQLREILGRLSNPTLDDKSREKFQALAQTIQNNMASLRAPSAARGGPLQRAAA